ncbi:MAG: 2-dehydropantoate 2-reductase [Spirochaetota bacterium]|nr:2-dehydropantoate 2-reductase [Spirochaetota bacterium]
MKILLIGTGSVGCFYGAKLAHAGGDITFFSRGKSFEIIKEKGIEIKSDLGDSFQTGVKIIDAIVSPSQFDLVIIATKSYDVKSLVDKLPKTLLASSHFMTVQNGLMSEDILSERVDHSRIIPATAFIGAIKIAPNVVHHTGGGRFQFGSYLGGPREGFLDELASLFEDSAIDLHFSENIMKMKWGKLVWNAAYNPISTVTGLKLGDILASPFGVDLLRESMNETVAVARKMGYAITDEFIDKQIDLPENLYSFKTSMLQDYQAGKPLELEAILGDLIRKGDREGVPTPAQRHLYALIQVMLKHRDKS